ncbi:MAG TPA: hypothetical protein VGO89_13075 [Streptomyces sp.]|nr:hypothetical protein [Streptomyces sp.]
MAALRCSRCGALIQLNGTTACSCVLPPADDLNTTYDAFRPRRKTASSRQAEASAPEPDPEETGETGRPRMGGRGKAVIGVVAAVTLGTAAFTLNSMSSGQEAQDGDRPPFSAWAPDEVPPEWMEGFDVPRPGGPHDGDPSESAEGGTSHEGGDESEDSGKHDASPAPAPSEEDSSPPSSGDANGGSTGGSSDAGGTQGGGSGDDGGDDQQGGKPGGLFGGLFGNGHGNGHGGDGNDNGRNESDHDNGRGHHNGGDHNQGNGRHNGGNHQGGGHGR